MKSLIWLGFAHSRNSNKQQVESSCAIINLDRMLSIIAGTGPAGLSPVFSSFLESNTSLCYRLGMQP